MPGTLTPAGEAAVADLAKRYRVSQGAVRNLLDAVIRGGGSMAQFSHPDLGGSGQWMRGGMTMVADMFNSGLQSTVSGICSELSSLMASGTVLVTVPGRTARTASLGSFGSGGDWWPEELGRPSSSGGQNDAAYAYFPGPRRLAIRHGGMVTLYDTGDHSISGVQQQQGGRDSLEFSSQFGTFTVQSLPIVDGAPAGAATEHTAAEHTATEHVATEHVATEDIPTANPPTRTPAAAAPAPAAPPAADPIAATPPSAGPDVAPPARTPVSPVVAPPAPTPASPALPVATPVPAGAASTATEIGAAIETLAGLRDKGFLTEDEFSAKKTDLLARL